MFTGIIEETGILKGIKRGRHSAVLEISAKKVLEDIHIGDSIAVNGVCLTVVSYDGNGFGADVMHETLERSALLAVKKAGMVNLERAMQMNGRFGGHIVAGHVDGVGKITEIRRDDTAIWFRIQADAALLRYIVEKGSVAVDGISLTVAKVTEEDFSVSVIPHTATTTALKEKKIGDPVNLETDLIGKYVEKLLAISPEKKKESRITREFLLEHGYGKE